MNKTVVLHILLLAATGALGGIVDYFTKSHAVWAPVALAILADIKPLLAARAGAQS